MTFRALLMAKAGVCLAFGVPLLVVPDRLLGLMGATLGAAGAFTAREYGAAMFGTLMLTWLARATQARDARRAILLDLLVYDAIGVVVTLGVVLTGVLNVLGWGIVAVYLFFTIGSGLLLLRERTVADARTPTAAPAG